ncbi:MAG: PKD domain-containing protein, partial [Candidatus Nitrosocosmicus sp.]
QTVNSGDKVTLDGSKSFDPNKNKLTYQWTQTSGPSVTLSDSSSANPTFTSPTVNSQAILKFQLVVNNGVDNSKPSSVTVTVQPINGIPSILTLSYADGEPGSAKDVKYVANFEVNNKNIKIVHVDPGSFDRFNILNDTSVEFHANEITKGDGKTAVVAIDYGGIQNSDIKLNGEKNIGLVIHTKVTVNGITKTSLIDSFVNIIGTWSKISGLSNDNFDLVHQLFKYATPCLNLSLDNGKDVKQYSLTLENCGDINTHVILSAFPTSIHPTFSSSSSSVTEYDINANDIGHDNVTIDNPFTLSSKKPLVVIAEVVVNVLGNYYNVGMSFALIP